MTYSVEEIKTVLWNTFKEKVSKIDIVNNTEDIFEAIYNIMREVNPSKFKKLY